MTIVDDGAVDDLREWKRNPELFIGNAILRIRRLEQRLVQLEKQVQSGQTSCESAQADSAQKFTSFQFTALASLLISIYMAVANCGAVIDHRQWQSS